ncbi:MAG: hypothetical protein V2B19_08520 [Pseudomonadota bacterium]
MVSMIPMAEMLKSHGILVGNPEADPELAPVNLIYGYPVCWSKFKVLRDFIQNFYDAVPKSEWGYRFRYKIEGDALFLTATDVGFSYDWLIPIGASTKREGDGSYAGYFGEGFKVASLCAIRDHGWEVEIRSRDWALAVTTTELKIDGCDLKSLAYNIWRRKDPLPDTVMCISPFTDGALLNTVLLSFYYPDNPLFGEKIWESPGAAVYFRSTESKPINYPCTYDDPGPGIIFAGYQALGSFQYPLIFCLHHFRFNDRERNSFFRMDVVRVIGQIASRLSPEASATVLRVVKSRWYDRPRKKYDFDSWHSIIAALTRNIAVSHHHKCVWRDQYPDLLVARQVKRSDLFHYNRRRQALDWAKSSERRFRLVQEAFLAIGYPTLEEACEQHDGFSITRFPRGLEVQRIQILERLVSLLLPKLLRQIEPLPCKVIQSERSAWQGMTECIPINDCVPSFRGLSIRYRLPYIALKESLLYSNNFGNALSTYLHELAHMFGGERSASFSRALSELMAITLSESRLIATCEEQWNNAGAV